jgi:hypothetical protein
MRDKRERETKQRREPKQRKNTDRTKKEQRNAARFGRRELDENWTNWTPLKKSGIGRIGNLKESTLINTKKREVLIHRKT